MRTKKEGKETLRNRKEVRQKERDSKERGDEERKKREGKGYSFVAKGREEGWRLGLGLMAEDGNKVENLAAYIPKYEKIEED